VLNSVETRIKKYVCWFTHPQLVFTMCCCFSRLWKKWYGADKSGQNWIDVPFYIRLTTFPIDHDGKIVDTKEVLVDDIVVNGAEVRSRLLLFLPSCNEIGKWGEPELTKTQKWKWSRYYIVFQDAKKIIVRFEFNNSAGGGITSISDALEQQFQCWMHMQNYDGFGSSKFFDIKTITEPSNLLSLSFDVKHL